MEFWVSLRCSNHTSPTPSAFLNQTAGLPLGHPSSGHALAEVIITHTSHCSVYTDLSCAVLTGWLDCMETSGVCLPSPPPPPPLPASVCTTFKSKNGSIIKTLSAAVRNSTHSRQTGNLKAELRFDSTFHHLAPQVCVHQFCCFL